MTQERRKYRRVPVFLECEIEGQSGPGVMRLTDLSLAGCFVETAADIPPDTDVTIRVRLRDRDVTRVGRTIHVQPGHGFGVSLEFSEQQDTVRRQVAEFLDRTAQA